MPVKVRPAEVKDAEAWWRLRNDPDVRAWIGQETPAGAEAHAKWYVDTIRNPEWRMFVAEDETGRVVGYGAFVVSVMAVGAGIGVDPEFRKQGVGEQILAAEEEAAKELGCWTFGGVVHPGNQVSWRLFMRRAFVVASRMPTLVKTLTRRNGGQYTGASI